ncbi:MAG: hypothetical protein F4082_04335 [Gammaproteobacteria bacterium]|nr:hypothetical protein [Gammaproteobacteria bacterium]
MKFKSTLSIFLTVLLVPLLTFADERSDAEVSCEATDQKLVYECMISIVGKKSRDPVIDAEFTVGAEMPSMPGAHNVRPVAAVPLDVAGKYRIQIDLEMMGEWVLLIDLTEPKRDRIVKKLHFSEKSVTEVEKAQ